MTEEEFYSNIDKWIENKISEWTHITLLAYFCHKYEQKNGVRFRLVRAKKGPTMGKEAADFAKLIRLFAPENYESLHGDYRKKIKSEIVLKVYNYINWMFDFKFRSGEKTVTGTTLFLSPSIMNDFERMYKKALEKNKTTNKFADLTSWCKENIPEVFDRHELSRKEDLEIIVGVIETYSLKENTIEYKLVSKAKEMGII